MAGGTCLHGTHHANRVKVLQRRKKPHSWMILPLITILLGRYGLDVSDGLLDNDNMVFDEEVLNDTKFHLLLPSGGSLKRCRIASLAARESCLCATG